MADPYAEQIDQQTLFLKTQMNEWTEELQLQIDELKNRVVSARNSGEAEGLRATIESLEKQQQNIRNSLKELEEVRLNTTIDFMNLWLEQPVKASSVGSNQSGEGSSVLGGEKKYMPDSISEKIQEASGASNKADSDVSDRLLKRTLISSSNRSEMERFSDDIEKPKKGMIERIQDSSSNDAEEVDAADTGAFSSIETNIPGLKEEMIELLRKGMKDKEGSGEDSENLTSENVVERGSAFVQSTSDDADLDPSLNLTEKMVALIHKCEEQLKECGVGEKKSLIEWLKDCNESDDHMEALKELKAQAVKKRTDFSNQLVDFVSLVAETEEISLEKFGRLCSFLGTWVDANRGCVVLSKIVDILGMAVQGVRGLKEEEPQGGSESEETEELILRFLKGVLQLELVLNQRRLSNSEMLLEEELSLLEADFRKFETELEGITSTVDERKASSRGFVTTPEDLNNSEYWRMVAELKQKATETWNKLESEEAEGQTGD